MKTCSTCKESKPLEMFSKNRARKDGRHTACKICFVTLNAAYYAANRDQIRAKTAAHRAANKEKTAAYNAARWADPRYRAAQAARGAAWDAENRDWRNWRSAQNYMLRGGR